MARALTILPAVLMFQNKQKTSPNQPIKKKKKSLVSFIQIFGLIIVSWYIISHIFPNYHLPSFKWTKSCEGLKKVLKYSFFEN